MKKKAKAQLNTNRQYNCCIIVNGGLLTLAVLAVLVACSDGVHAVTGCAVGGGAV